MQPPGAHPAAKEVGKTPGTSKLPSTTQIQSTQATPYICEAEYISTLNGYTVNLSGSDADPITISVLPESGCNTEPAARRNKVTGVVTLQSGTQYVNLLT